MSAAGRSRILALALSLVPGWGHIYWGREALGLVLFTVFAVGGFALLNGAVIYIGRGQHALIASGAALIIGTAIGAWAHILLATSPRRVQASEERRQKALREGTVAYLRGDFKTACELFQGCVEDDPSDFEALFRLGVVCSRAGDVRRARSWLRRVRRHDLEDKWRWEVDRELRRLKTAASAGGTAGSSPRKAAEKSTAV